MSRLRWLSAFLIPVLLGMSGCAANGAGSRGSRIEEASFVSVGGIRQWVTVRGDDVKNPVLLYVHGGPADPQSALVGTYAPYEHDFVLVQWDQRGAGRTFLENRGATQELSLERMAADGIELAEYLRKHLGRKKIIVLGHSWGSMLATEMVLKRPDLFSAYVGTGQVSNWRASVATQWAHLRTAATAARDRDTLDRMNAIGEPDPFNVAQYFSWRNILNRKYLRPADATWLQRLRTMQAETGYTADELKALGEGAALSAQQLLKTMMSTNLNSTAKQMPIPFYVIQGRDDLYTPTAPVIDYFNVVKAPKKKLIVIDDAGHFVVATHSREFLDALAQVGLGPK